MQTGIDAQAYEKMAQVFGSPVTASGGVATMDDIEKLGKVANSIDGIITGRAVYEGAIDVTAAVERCKELTRKALAAEVRVSKPSAIPNCAGAESSIRIRR
jgi:phosphoribosylformimino-5-aminoimidazole carboxamide ribotide isomerase